MNVIKQTFIKVMAKGSSPMMKHMFAVTGDLSKAFYEKDGKEAIPIITEVVSTLLGQEMEMQILKSVAAGDKECEVIFSKK